MADVPTHFLSKWQAPDRASCQEGKKGGPQGGIAVATEPAAGFDIESIRHHAEGRGNVDHYSQYREKSGAGHDES
jgi:hypothetical protein